MSSGSPVRDTPSAQRNRAQRVAQLASDAELGSLALSIFDALHDDISQVGSLGQLQRYQLALLGSFLDSAHRGSLKDVGELAAAHAAAAESDRPLARQTTLDDDEDRWRLVVELEDEDEPRAAELVSAGIAVIDEVVSGQEPSDQEFIERRFLPFLDRLAHADQSAGAVEIEGYHSLYN